MALRLSQSVYDTIGPSLGQALKTQRAHPGLGASGKTARLATKNSIISFNPKSREKIIDILSINVSNYSFFKVM